MNDSKISPLSDKALRILKGGVVWFFHPSLFSRFAIGVIVNNEREYIVWGPVQVGAKSDELTLSQTHATLIDNVVESRALAEYELLKRQLEEKEKESQVLNSELQTLKEKLLLLDKQIVELNKNY